MRLLWSNKAIKRIVNLHIFYSKKKTKEYSREIKRQTNNIMNNPEIGIRSRVKGFRKLYIVNTPFYVVYDLIPSTEYPEIAQIITIVNTKYQKEVNSY